jgi:hypothetical protein
MAAAARIAKVAKHRWVVIRVECIGELIEGLCLNGKVLLSREFDYSNEA